MKFILYISLLVFTVSCLNPQDRKAKMMERNSNKVSNCLKDKFNSYEINITKTFHDYEKYLLETNILKDTNAESYINAFNYIRDNYTQKTPLYKYVDNSFPKDTIIVNNYISFTQNCMNEFIKEMQQKQSEYENSALYEYQQQINDLIKDFIPIQSEKADNYNPTIDSSYFQTRFFKHVVLSLIYTDEFNFSEKRKRDALTKFIVTITEDEVIKINGEKVPANKLSEFVNNEKEKFTDYEKENYIVKLIVEPKTKMEIVKEVRNELWNSNSLNIYFSTLRENEK
ncbi:MAG: hypothetical protein OQJ96_06470 [Flavobacteriales bacterium]|nr:hypothetical protein [Flavobacteriales bacterium]MCW8913768.1 hypothetical protein [Flavobacteriales bacterium]MCW8938450.1 hypothetical protein [Flavobacteriales bacterium]MCW8939272.1 hypothetical protein [Flavobacteriales bacterium]MCW8969235.1 hypothetical protein [Flavobacteriales bacterium]